MTESSRKPAVFSVDDPRIVVARPEEPIADEIAAEAPDTNLPALPAPPPRKGFSWGGLFWSALSGLVVMGLGLAVTSLIEDLFARNPWLGAAGLALGVLAGLLGLGPCAHQLRRQIDVGHGSIEAQIRLLSVAVGGKTFGFGDL